MKPPPRGASGAESLFEVAQRTIEGIITGRNHDFDPLAGFVYQGT